MMRRKKAEPRTPHFLSLSQDIVAWPQEEKCGLKYVMQSFGRPSQMNRKEKGRAVAGEPIA
jgi:hypothetical protein